MDAINTEQFEDDLHTVVFSTTEHIFYNYRLPTYGGMCAVDEPFHSVARKIAIEHRVKNSAHPLTEQEATREIDQELKDPSRCSFQGFLKQVKNHGGNVPQDICQRLLTVAGEFTQKKKTLKPTTDELVDIALEKAQTTYDLDCMAGKDAGESQSRREVLDSMYRENLRIAEHINPLTKKKGGNALVKHGYSVKKGLHTCIEALEVSTAFVDPSTNNLIVPYLSAGHLENRWRDSRGNPVEMSNIELAVRNCFSYQKTPAGDGPKRFCTGTKTSGLFSPIGNIVDASLVIAQEGFGSAISGYEAAKIPSMSVGSCDNFLPAVASILENNVCNRILMIGDAGTEDKLKKVHAAIKAHSLDWGRKVAWTTVPGPSNYDLNDMMIDSGIEAVKTFIDDKVERFHELNEPEPGTAFINSLSELMKNSKPAKALIKGVIYEKSLSSLTGATMAGKSFVAVLIAFCVATGLAFHGRKSRQANVLYIAGEGNHGLIARFKALLITFGLAEMPANLFVTAGPIDLLNPDEVSIITAFIEEHEVELVIIDTFARCFAADENSAKDMGAAIQAITRHLIGKGAAVLLVHHTGHGDQSRARGSSSFRAALDTEIGVEKIEGGLKLKCWKAKDFEPWPEANYKFNVVDTGLLDEDNEPVTSLILEQCEAPASKPAELNSEHKKVVASLKMLVQPFNFELAFSDAKQSISSSNKRQTLKRLIEKLIKSQEIIETDGFFRFV